MAALAELSDDLVAEFLLRLSPEDPACLLRASLVCKRWRRILADPAFHRRHRALYPTPSVLGFFPFVEGSFPFASRFVPIGPASGRPASRELPGWLPQDCRHGRALFVTLALGTVAGEDSEFVVWDPLTNQQRRLPPPSPPLFHSVIGSSFNAAVLCAATAEGCDHRDCHGGPFLVVYIFTDRGYGSRYNTYACLYSSETDDWSEAVSFQGQDRVLHVDFGPSALVGDRLYFRGHFWFAFEYHLRRHQLSVIDEPPTAMRHGYFIFLLSRDEGGLEFAVVEDEPRVRLRLYSLKNTRDGVSHWAESRAFELETLLPDGSMAPYRLRTSQY